MIELAQRTDAEILADIAAAKEDFLTARYGRDVRDAMGSLAQGVYDALEYFDETPHYKGALSDPDLNALKSDEIYSVNMSGDIDFQPRPVNASGVCMLLCLGSGGSTCYQVLFASGGRIWSRRYLSTSSSWTEWAQIGLQPSRVTITASNKGDYFDDANDAPTNSIYRITSAAHIENTPYGDGMTAATGDYDGDVRNIKKYANGTLMTFGSDNSLKTQIFIHDTTRPIMYYRVYYSGYEEGKRWGEWMAVSSKISPTSTNVAIRAKLVAPYLDSGGNPTMTDTGTPNDEFVDDPMFFSDMNDAPNNSIYQIDKDLTAEFMAHNPHPGKSSVLITTGFSWSSEHGKIQFCVGTDDGETFFATRYGYQNTATQYIWTPWLNVVDAEAVESLRSLIYEGRSTEDNKPHIMTWFTYGSGTELSLQSMPKWSQTYARGAELKALVGSYFPDPASLRDTTPYLVEKTAMLSSQDVCRYKISTYNGAFQWEGYSLKNTPDVILWTKTVFPVGDMASAYDDSDFIITNMERNDRWWNATGGFSTDTALKHSQPIPVKAGKTYYVSGFNISEAGPPQATGGAFLDIHGRWIAPVTYPYGDSAGNYVEKYDYRYADVTSQNKDDGTYLYGGMPYAEIYEVTPPEGAAYISLNLTNNSFASPQSHASCSFSTLPMIGYANSGDRRWAKDDPLRKLDKKLYIISPSNGTIDRGRPRAVDYQSHQETRPDVDPMENPGYGNIPRNTIVGFQEYLIPYYKEVVTLAFSGLGYRIPKADEPKKGSILYYLREGEYEKKEGDIEDADEIIIFGNNNNVTAKTLGRPFDGDESTYCGSLEALFQFCYDKAGNRPVRIFFYTGSRTQAPAPDDDGYEYFERKHQYSLEICRRYNISVIDNWRSNSLNNFSAPYYTYDWYKHPTTAYPSVVDYHPNGLHSNNRGNELIAQRILGALLHDAGIDMVSRDPLADHSESHTLSWEPGGISSETGDDVSFDKRVRSSRIWTDGYSAFTLDSETVGMFYVYEYSRGASVRVNQCVPGEVYELSETAYAVRITFELNPQAKISPNTEDATKVAGGRTRIIFADTAAYKAYENRMGYPVPGWQNGNLVSANGYYSTASHYSGSLASYPLPIGKAGKIFLKSIDPRLVFAVFQYNRNGQLLAPPASNLKENAAVDVLEGAYCYRVTAHYPEWPDITPEAAGYDRVTLLTGPSLFSTQTQIMYDVLRDAETEPPGPMLTIIDDDGNAKFYTDVLPIVQEEHVPIACAFITGKPGPTDNHMTWEQVEEANRSGAEILCHTYNHWSGDDISGKSKHDMSDEYRKAKFTLEQHGVQSNLLVYSGSTGLYLQSNKGAAAAGFKGAFLAGDNVSNVRGSIDPFRIKRYRIGSDYAWNFNTLKTLLDSLVSNGGWMVWMMHTSDAARWTDGTGDTPDAKAVLREVCRYAKTLNIEIVTAEAGFHAYCE